MKDNSQPFGNSRSLVPEVRSMKGINIAPDLAACKSYEMPKIDRSTMTKNNSFQDLKGTGRS